MKTKYQIYKTVTDLKTLLQNKYYTGGLSGDLNTSIQKQLNKLLEDFTKVEHEQDLELMDLDQKYTELYGRK